MSVDKLNQPCFQLKADFFPMTVFKITHYDFEKIGQQLDKTIQTAPNYFQNAPMIIDLNAIKKSQASNLEKICRLLREQTIIPVGVRGLEKSHHKFAIGQNLAIINDAKKPMEINQPKQISSSKLETSNKIITRPVRSGTHVYAKSGDLIILAAVNAGGECIADGNIHVYGPLRGRALAGANGNESARIFCKKLDAELISIAGHYLTNDNFQQPKTNHSMVQIYLKNGSLIIEAI